MEESLVPNTPPISEPSQEQVILFELVAERGDEYDSALITTLGRGIIAHLQQEGFRVSTPVYSGQKGGFLVELLTGIQQIGITVWENHALITEGIADFSGLVAIFGGILPILKRTIEVHEKQVGKTEGMERPIKITVEIDGASVVIETAEVAQLDAALKLALKYRSLHPNETLRATAKSKTKIQGQVPARKRRPRK